MSTFRQDIPVLSGIRGLAVAIVFLSHASNLYFGGKFLGWGGGQLGVMIFFMLSGFLMAYLYADAKPTPAALREFAVNRISRIYPMFAFVVLVCFAVKRLALPAYVYPIGTLRELLLHLGLVHGFEVLWTIGPEVIFYGLFMMLWRLRWYRRGYLEAFACILVAASWLPVNGLAENSLAQLHDRLPYFVVGAAMGLKSEFFTAKHGDSRGWLLGSFVASALVFLLAFPQIFKLTGMAPARLTGDPWSDPWSFPFYLLITASLFATSMLAQPLILTNRVAVFVGRISFSFYLLHFAILKNCQSLMPDHPLRTIAVAGGLTLLASTACFYLIERPCLRAIRSWQRRGKQAVVIEAPTASQRGV